MPKRNITVIYNSDLDKKELFESAKEEIINIYNSFKEQFKLDDNERNILNLALKLKLDNNKDSYFRILFLLSLYCTYFHKIKHKINVKNLTNLQHECFKKHNFVILDQDDSNKIILQDLSVYFNTDANNIEPITGKILYDLNNINVQFEKS
jgi:hypothetical protein